MKGQHFILWPLSRRDTFNIGNKLGFHWQMTHVEFTSDVAHLHNIEWWKMAFTAHNARDALSTFCIGLITI